MRFVKLLNQTTIYNIKDTLHTYIYIFCPVVSWEKISSVKYFWFSTSQLPRRDKTKKRERLVPSSNSFMSWTLYRELTKNCKSFVIARKIKLMYHREKDISCLRKENVSCVQNVTHALFSTSTPYLQIYITETYELMSKIPHFHKTESSLCFLGIWMYPYIEKFEVVWAPNIFEYRKTKKYVSPIFGFL